MAARQYKLFPYASTSHTKEYKVYTPDVALYYGKVFREADGVWKCQSGNTGAQVEPFKNRAAAAHFLVDNYGSF